MGIFSFMKDVGEKLLEHNAGSAKAGATHPDPQQLAQKLEQHIQSLNLGVESPRVRVEGDKAIIEGKANSQEALEKTILAVGNTAGIAQVDARIEAPQHAEPSFYTVKKGDTLSKISKEMLGDANRYNEIFEANRPMLKSADAIYPGQQLRIEQKAAKAA